MGTTRPWPRSPAVFALAAVGWSLGLFALLRVPWIETRLVLPLTELQRQIATWYGGSPSRPVVVSAECSAADAIALFLGVTLAYPAPWRSRLHAAAGGVALILGLNTVRVGTLLRAAASPSLFEVLHRYVWPVALVLAAAGYAFLWMRATEARRAALAASSAPAGAAPGWPIRRFAILAVVFLGLFAAAAPWAMGSATLLAVAAWIAGVAGVALGALGIATTVSGNVLSTGREAFLVTQECVVTPLIPLWAAAAVAFPRSLATRGLALLAVVPVFVGLGIVRVLLVALPSTLVGSPLFVVHGFYQLLVAALAVGLASLGRDRFARGTRRRALVRALLAWGAGLGLAVALGGAYTRAVIWATDVARAVAPHALTHLSGPDDVQGALRLLPAYQVGLLVALGIAAFPKPCWRRIAIGLGLLASSQVLLLVALGEAVAHLGFAPHALLVRAGAVAGTVAVFLVLMPGMLPGPGRRARAASGSGAARSPSPSAMMPRGV